MRDFIHILGLSGEIVIRVSDIERINENRYHVCSEILLYNGKVIQSSEKVKTIFDKIYENQFT